MRALALAAAAALAVSAVARPSARGLLSSLVPASSTCTDCKAVVAAIGEAVQSKDADVIVQAIAEDVCKAGHGGFGWNCGNPWACNDLCRGITSLFTPEILYIAAQAALNPQEDCQAIGLCNATAPAPPAIAGAEPVRAAAPANPPPPQAKAAQILKVMHITDLHWDPNYTVGGRSDCGEPDCCRGVQGSPTSRETTCGYWGDHGGDIPTQLVDHMLEFAATLSPDFVMLTGDYPPHMVWNVTAEAVLEVASSFTAKVKAAFGDTPVFGTAGNHEGAPINQFRLELNGEGSRRLFGPLAKQWGGYGWLDTRAQAELAAGGYYTSLVPNVTTPDGRPLRLVVLHPGYHMSSNYYTLLDHDVGVANETTWMRDVVERAAADGEVVWVLTHHPTNDGGYAPAFMEGFFAPLVARHRDTVRHVFSGHTHKASMSLLWANRTNGTALEPAVTVYVGAAPTPFQGVNPTFRVYDVDAATMEVVDYTDYTVDLEAQGLLHQMTASPEPRWRPSYSARDEFNMTGLSPADWHAMAERMRVDDALFRRWETKYHTNNTAIADFSPTERLTRVCDIVGGTKDLYHLCKQGKFNASGPLRE